MDDTNSNPSPTAVINHLILFSTRCKSESELIKENPGNYLYIYFGTPSIFGRFSIKKAK
jgi:hypothetical protein